MSSELMPAGQAHAWNPGPGVSGSRICTLTILCDLWLLAHPGDEGTESDFAEDSFLRWQRNLSHVGGDRCRREQEQGGEVTEA